MRAAVCIAVLLACAAAAGAVDRFPPPDFRTGYAQPEPTTPPPRADWLDWVDLGVLVAAIAAASYFALRRRSRAGLLVVTVAALLWLGFVRKGCVCPIGAIQHVAAGLLDPGFAVALVAAAFLLVPLAATLLAGRTFCGAVCPLGAVQELVLLRPISVPPWLGHVLGFFPFVYLGLAVLFAALGAGFVICRYDPFVGFFRLSAPAAMLVLGVATVVICLFVGRAYCRFVCPLGAVFRLLAPLAPRRARITPTECVRCRLCEDACPHGAIRPPTPAGPGAERSGDDRAAARRTLAIVLLLLPALVGVGAVTGYLVGPLLARSHYTVRLAEQVRREQLGLAEPTDELTDPAAAFRASGQPREELMRAALELRGEFRVGAAIVGAFLGLVLGGKLVSLSLRRPREEYDTDPSLCFACGRCFAACPMHRKRDGAGGEGASP